MAININIGELKKVVEILEVVTTTDDSGFQVEDYEVLLKTRAKMEFDDRLIREVFREEGVDSTVVKIFTIRYIPNLSTKHIIRYNNTLYEIYAINNLDEENRYLRIWGKTVCL